jgi:hypothetical protein
MGKPTVNFIEEIHCRSGGSSHDVSERRIKLLSDKKSMGRCAAPKHVYRAGINKRVIHDNFHQRMLLDKRNDFLQASRKRSLRT